MNIEILKSIKEITQRISSFFIFLFIYLVLRDIVEVVKFDLSVDDVKYILSFNALLYTSILITGFFLLIYILANKNMLSYFIVLLCFVVFFIFNGIGDMEKFLAFIFIVVIFLKHEQIYDWFQDFEELKNFINITLVILLFIIFWSFTFLLGGFEKISTNNQNEPEFLYHKDIFSRLLEPKFFSPAKLEKSYDFVEFKNSKVALDELNNIIMNNGKLPYFGFEGKFWVWFMQNNEKYRVFFVLKDDKLTTIVTMVLENNKFQIIKYLSKDVNAKSTGIHLESMSRLEWGGGINLYKSKKIAKQTATVAEFTKYINKILPKNTARDFRVSSGARTKRTQNMQTKQGARTRLAFLAATGVILAAEIYIAICVKGGFVRHYAGDVLAVILLYALARAIFSVPPLNLPLKIFAFAAALELAQYFGAVQILGIENKILKIMIGGTFDFADLLCYATGCVLAGMYEKFEKRRSDG